MKNIHLLFATISVAAIVVIVATAPKTNVEINPEYLAAYNYSVGLDY